MLLGRPWIHENFVVPSTLHQCFKYIGEDNEVHTVFADLKPFKGLEAYCTDAELYDDGFGKEEEDNALQVHVVKNKESSSVKIKYAQGKVEPQWRKKEKYIIHDEVIPKTSKYVVNAITKKGAKEKAEAKRCKGDIDFLQAKMKGLKMTDKDDTSSGFTFPLPEVHDNSPMEEGESAIFIVEKGRLGEKPIIFIRGPKNPNSGQAQEDESGSLDFASYSPQAHRMMSLMGYDFENPIGLNYGRGRLLMPECLYPEYQPVKEYVDGKKITYYPGLGYKGFNFENGKPEWEAKTRQIPPKRPFHSKCWRPKFSINATTVSGLEEEQDSREACQNSGKESDKEEIIATPPTEDKLQEVNLGTEEQPRPIFLNADLSNEELKQYVVLLREYLDVFAWSYAEMPGLDPEVATHSLAIRPGSKPIKQGQRRCHPEVMQKIKAEVQKLKDVGFIREEMHPE